MIGEFRTWPDDGMPSSGIAPRNARRSAGTSTVLHDNRRLYRKVGRLRRGAVEPNVVEATAMP